MVDHQKLSGRPQLGEGKRSRKINARFTEDEFRLIEGMERELGLSKTELIRIRLLSNAGNIVINSRALLKELDGIGAELGRSGNNINQLARHANILQLQDALSPLVVTKFNLLMDGHLKILQQLEISLRKVIKALGHG